MGLSGPRCLDESEPYATISRRAAFFKKYYRYMALAPFVVALFGMTRIYGKSPMTHLTIIPVYLALLWAMFIALYSLLLMVQTHWIRCPRCRGRFGLRDDCRSCGLPRHCPKLQP